MKNPILIVDDDDAVRVSLKKVLEQAGYEVVMASNAQEARTQLESSAAGLVLLDLNLPDQSGWELLERLLRRTPTVPVVVITGLPGQCWAKEVASFAPILEKPLDAAVLLNTVQELLEEPREIRLRRFSAFLETSSRIPEVGATYLERMPRYPASLAGRAVSGLPDSHCPG